MADKIFEKLEKTLSGVQKDILFERYTTYRIGGPASYFFVAKTKDELLLALRSANIFKLSVFILGGGSNILVSEKGFKGLVIKVDIQDILIKGNTVFTGAGTNLTKLAYMLADSGLSGLEWSAGVPGTIGGSIHGNAHAFGTKISDIIESVECVDVKKQSIVNFSKEECCFSLKDSIFKRNKNLIIISAVLKLKEESTESVRARIKGFLEYRREKHPVNFPTAGSVFVNPEIKITNKKALEKFPELAEYNKKGAIPAGYLIEKSGLSGQRKGAAQISEKHCNFIVNLGGAKAKDVISLMKLARKKVYKTFGIKLQPELQLINCKKI